MEADDKTYMWLAIITFIALCIAGGFAFAELHELKSENVASAPRFEVAP